VRQSGNVDEEWHMDLTDDVGLILFALKVAVLKSASTPELGCGANQIWTDTTPTCERPIRVFFVKGVSSDAMLVSDPRAFFAIIGCVGAVCFVISALVPSPGSQATTEPVVGAP
jgi:hypothetical protein